jgi:Tfp pilus assembly protein PilO
MPFGTIVHEWRRVLVPLAALAVLNVALYVVAVYPLAASVSSLERRAGRAKAQLAGAEQEERAARATIATSTRADEDLRRFYDEVLPAHLAGARRLTYARVAQLADEANLLYDRRTFEQDTNYQGALRRLRIGMELEGDYTQIREFIHRLETASEFIVIEDLSLRGGNASDAPITLSVQLATYFRAEDDGR